MPTTKSSYIIVPDDNIFNQATSTDSFDTFRSMHLQLNRNSFTNAAQLSATSSAGDLGVEAPKPATLKTDAGNIELIDSIDLNEATLARMTPEQAHRFARRYPGLRVTKELMLYPLLYRVAGVVMKSAKAPTAGPFKTITVRCVDADTGAPVPDAEIVIVLNRKKGLGIKDIRTSADGSYTCALPASLRSIDSVICAPLSNYWPNQSNAIPVGNDNVNVEVAVPPIAAGYCDALGHLIDEALPEDGKGVKVAVIDGGVSVAPGLNVKAGLNTTRVESPNDWTDNGSGHGTHVAGIISRVAPAAELYVYRVFERAKPGAKEFAVTAAIRKAVDDGCDLINLSLGQQNEPISISRETRRARALGVVCIAAVGNDYMSAVSYPARTHGVVAVTAAGVLDAFPESAMTGINVAEKPAPVGSTFFATFSNIGPEVDFIGPGVGIISSVSDVARGVMDGTSMSCPAVTGLFARLLSRRPALLAADRDQQRSDDIVKEANAHAKVIGFGPEYEGAGLINVV